MEETDLETQTPKPEEETTSENLEEEAPKAEEKGKTLEQLQKEINTLAASRQWEKQKRREAEEKALKIEEELLGLKEQFPSTPSEEEFSKKIPDWEYFDEGTREMYRKLSKIEKELFDLKIGKVKEEMKEKWENEFEDVVIKNPELGERKIKEEFREFTDKEEYKNVPLPVLAELFISKITKEEEKKIPKPGLEKATGGERKEQKSLGAMTSEEASKLREKNPQLYHKLIKEKRLKIEG